MKLKRLLCVVLVCIFVGCMIPSAAFAVDPVSATVMANAFAQAFTAYGAAHNVSTMFDVTNTDGIGEGIHELYNQFANDRSQDGIIIQSFDSVIVTFWENLFTKVGDNIGFNITSEKASILDDFWNWVLSGPAEMVRVDNQYYEWTVDQATGTVLPIPVFNTEFLNINGKAIKRLPIQVVQSSTYLTSTFEETNSTVYAYACQQPGGAYKLIVLSTVSSIVLSVTSYNSSADVTTTSSQTVSTSAYTGTSYRYGVAMSPNSSATMNVPIYPISTNNAYTPYDVFGAGGSAVIDTAVDNVSVQPYVGNAVAEGVNIPDNTDVNYAPIPLVIPTDIAWDQTWPETITDSVATDIVDTIDSVIEDTETIELEETVDPGVPGDPAEVYIPFLPIALPSFNFNFSGIWHYVRDWVSSLGAFLTTLFSVWAALPYAIVLPVYASAVIVIVLGVYRRFFM